jgi:molybdopterin-guanine dinucleotide biosynthesis protein A
LHLIDDKPIIEHLIDRLLSQTNTIAINTNERQLSLSRYDLPILQDRFTYNSGPLAGILTAMEYAKNNALVMTVAADTPFIPTNLIEKMLFTFKHEPTDVVFAKSQGKRHPTIGLWNTKCAPHLRQWLEQGHKPSIIHFASNINSTYADFPRVQLKNGQDYDPFFNINELHDLVEARALLKQIVS